jgi:Ca-activated chloride channel family protein
MSAQGRSTLVWLDQGYWLLPPLLVMGLLAFRRGGGLAVLLLIACLPLQPARAATHDWWRRPDQLAHDRIEQGAQAYRKGDFATAQTLWQGVPVADAAYNRGNALARQGDYDQAIAAYDEALRLQPGMADALANRRAVDAARKRKPPPGKQSGQGKDNPQQGTKGQSQPGAGQQQGQSKAQPQGGGGDAGQKPTDARQPPQSGQQSPAPAGAQAPKAADAATQRQADAAQRARMQQALQQGKANADGNDRGAEGQRRVETRAERERRLANEAWLQRVPYDPGGLLRAKFRLEFERRQQEGGE